MKILILLGYFLLFSVSTTGAYADSMVKDVRMTTGYVRADMEDHGYAMVMLFRDPYLRFKEAILYQQVGASCEVLSVHQPDSMNGIGQTNILVSFKPERRNGYKYCIIDLVQDDVYSPGRRTTYQVELGVGTDE